MKATYNKAAKTKFTSSYRKEGKCYFESYNALVNEPNYEGSLRTSAIVELRLYGTDNTWYAAIWVHGKEIHTSGTGKAGGYGYHKPSAAAEEAILNAGFKLSERIAGAGDSAIESAIKAIAESVGYPEALIFKAHQ